MRGAKRVEEGERKVGERDRRERGLTLDVGVAACGDQRNAE